MTQSDSRGIRLGLVEGLLILGVIIVVALAANVAGVRRGLDLYYDLKADVSQEAKRCHTMRNLGYNAWATKMANMGNPVPIKDCTTLYILAGEKEPPLDPDAQAFENEVSARIDAAAKEASNDQ